jgi:heat-inducible transcriptional repressor
MTYILTISQKDISYIIRHKNAASEERVIYMELADRKKRILSAIVEEYIATGEPVGSKFLANVAGIKFSSATIRNEMAELEELGYLEQPHTSAGRIPTQFGYRMYVDHLMGSYSLTSEERGAFDNMLRLGGDIESTLEKAGDVLAQVTGCAAVSTTPDDKAAAIRRIQIIPAGARSILLVILTTSGIIKSCLCRISEDLTADMVGFFSRFVDDRFCGITIDRVTPGFVNGIKGELYEYTYALSPIVDIIAEELHSASSGVFVGGATNLLAHREFDSEKIVKIMKFLESRDELLQVIGGVNGVSVSIGAENGRTFMKNSALIAAPYAFKGKICGAVGIIGPSRINYAKMMSSIEYFSTVLSRLINESFGD